MAQVNMMRPKVAVRWNESMARSQDLNFAPKRTGTSALGCNPRGPEEGRKLKVLRITFTVFMMIPLVMGQSSKAEWEAAQGPATRKQTMQKQSISNSHPCDKCNQRIKDKMESVFVAHSYGNVACYNHKNFLDICVKNRKMYWVGKNLGFKGRAPYPHNDQICPQYEKFFCFEKDENENEPNINIALKEKKEIEKSVKKIPEKELEELNQLYKQLKEQYSDWDLPTTTKTLFVDLMQEIATELGLSKCWVCEGLRMAERWPWRGESSAPEQFLKWNHTQISKTLKQPGGWILSHQVIGTVCITREGKKYNEVVEYTPCTSTLGANSENNTKTWQPKTPAGYWGIMKETNCEWDNHIDLCRYKSPGANPYQSISNLKFYWEQPGTTSNKGKAPDGIYWICGQRTYSELPQKWKGICTLGIIQPSFFVIPRSRTNMLGTPLYKTLERNKRDLNF
uniref:Uncharacterized protein n=1 Tax=Cyanistes caeruleus TaxID=156563 RepID=A0A8C0ZH35_CYACU